MDVGDFLEESIKGAFERGKTVHFLDVVGTTLVHYRELKTVHTAVLRGS